MPKIKRTYAAPIVAQEPSLATKPPSVAAPNRRFTDYDVDKLVFWVCVLLFAIAFAWVK
jgi:hypothetical protein